MRFLDLLFSSENQPSQEPTAAYEDGFTELPLKLFSTPCLAIMDVQQGSPLMVKFAGTYWHFQFYGAEPTPLVDGQRVKVLGRQGNCLLIELETSHD
ncbi:hypothetical protein IQ268_08020 [Oculatella sp. LEGE 06141]|uniref:NfeD family protein n=1 Tax=Oculatella sp. LEGE 06141 TaxID=1828648 RepID=UPI00187E66B1|nr:NfeD family protein [Oculatella sp. LEGE 06141]MBE9178505.1 hypothetical protein [Oculatella sp. LEGE 06141]